MKSLLRDKQIYWPHFRKGMAIIFVGGLSWFLSKPVGIMVIVQGLAWSVPELLFGGNEE